ncbi:DUF4190 domain-containing protein [Georgenia ruanii]|uniref:DUF4190 domain-containing protein n=1 Tax=Georgenia ruanii TaxID=348442 RepID=UPI001264DF7E|nr:DUF4190 domain-containing protein [Georgenia ruanii]
MSEIHQDPSTTPGHGYQPPAPYGQQAPQWGHGAPVAPPAYGYSAQAEQARKAEQLSLIFGILALLVFGLVFGPLALRQARKAEAAGGSATAGKVLGWIGLACSIVGLVVFGILAGGIVIAGSGGY